MKYKEIAQNVVRYMESKKNSKKRQTIVINFAVDIQGHALAGDKQRGINTVLFADEALKIIRDKVKELGGVLIVTADHGNIEEMARLDDNGMPLKDKYGVIPSSAHSRTNPVPFIIEGLEDVELKEGLGLASVEATKLDLLGIKARGKAESVLKSYKKREIEGPIVTLILDGWGENQFTNPEALEWDAIHLAQPPTFNDLKNKNQWTTLKAHGSAVGLPEDERHIQMGDSDSGHSTMGAAEIVPTLFGKIMALINSGEFQNTKLLREKIQKAMDSGKDIGIGGLISDGGVHSHYRYVIALMELAAEMGIKSTKSIIKLYAGLDGRDAQTRVPTENGAYYLEEIINKALELGLEDHFIVGVAVGRDSIMDRDAVRRDKLGKHSEAGVLWNARFKKVYDAMVYGIGDEAQVDTSLLVKVKWEELKSIKEIIDRIVEEKDKIFRAKIIDEGVRTIPGTITLMEEIHKSLKYFMNIVSGGRSAKFLLDNADFNVLGYLIDRKNIVIGSKLTGDPWFEGGKMVGIRPEDGVAIDNHPTGVKEAKKKGFIVIAIDKEGDKTEDFEAAGADLVLPNLKGFNLKKVIELYEEVRTAEGKPLSFKGVLFDNDGVTIANTELVHFWAYEQVINSYFEFLGEKFGKVYRRFSYKEDYYEHIEAVGAYPGLENFFKARNITFDEEAASGSDKASSPVTMVKVQYKGQKIEITQEELQAHLRFQRLLESYNARGRFWQYIGGSGQKKNGLNQDLLEVILELYMEMERLANDDLIFGTQGEIPLGESEPGIRKSHIARGDERSVTSLVLLITERVNGQLLRPPNLPKIWTPYLDVSALHPNRTVNSHYQQMVLNLIIGKSSEKDKFIKVLKENLIESRLPIAYQITAEFLQELDQLEDNDLIFGPGGGAWPKNFYLSTPSEPVELKAIINSDRFENYFIGVVLNRVRYAALYISELERVAKGSSPIQTPGGIDLNPSRLNLQIKRDGNGVPLPINLQPLETIQIDGFFPVIINITPVLSLPMLSSVVSEQPIRQSDNDEDYQPFPMAYLKEN